MQAGPLTAIKTLTTSWYTQLFLNLAIYAKLYNYCCIYSSSYYSMPRTVPIPSSDYGTQLYLFTHTPHVEEHASIL